MWLFREASAPASPCDNRRRPRRPDQPRTAARSRCSCQQDLRRPERPYRCRTRYRAARQYLRGTDHARKCRYISLYEYGAKACSSILVFDLHKVAGDYFLDPAALRARDLASERNENGTSRYRGYIKFSGAHKGQQGLALSTVVSAANLSVPALVVFDYQDIYVFAHDGKAGVRFRTLFLSKSDTVAYLPEKQVHILLFLYLFPQHCYWQVYCISTG